MVENTMIRTNASTMVAENEVNYSFTPYEKITAEIDKVSAVMNFSKMIGKVEDMIRLDSELTHLQSQIVEIQKRNIKNRLR